MPIKSKISVDEAKWERIRAVRDDVLAALEIKRNEKVIGKSLEAKVIIEGGEDLSDVVSELAQACIVSQAMWIAGGEKRNVTVMNADGEKCERCWIYSTEINDNLCERCVGVVK
jgi:isoleucyl-tRNA synthetase